MLRRAHPPIRREDAPLQRLRLGVLALFRQDSDQEPTHLQRRFVIRPQLPIEDWQSHAELFLRLCEEILVGKLRPGLRDGERATHGWRRRPRRPLRRGRQPYCSGPKQGTSNGG